MNTLHIPEIQNQETDRTDVTTKKTSLYGYDDVATEKKRITGTPSGTKFAIDVATQEILKKYSFSDKDESGEPAYYGFVDIDGGWCIRQFNDTAGTMRFVKGDSDYTTAWTNRASQSYDYFYNIFS